MQKYLVLIALSGLHSLAQASAWTQASLYNAAHLQDTSPVAATDKHSNKVSGDTVSPTSVNEPFYDSKVWVIPEFRDAGENAALTYLINTNPVSIEIKAVFVSSESQPISAQIVEIPAGESEVITDFSANLITHQRDIATRWTVLSSERPFIVNGHTSDISSIQTGDKLNPAIPVDCSRPSTFSFACELTGR